MIFENGMICKISLHASAVSTASRASMLKNARIMANTELAESAFDLANIISKILEHWDRQGFMNDILNTSLLGSLAFNFPTIAIQVSVKSKTRKFSLGTSNDDSNMIKTGKRVADDYLWLLSRRDGVVKLELTELASNAQYRVNLVVHPSYTSNLTIGERKFLAGLLNCTITSY